MAYAGFDMARYPGNKAMSWLWEHTNLYWVGYYLAVSGPGLADKKTWMGQYNGLIKMGWGVAPVYGGKQPDSQKLKSSGQQFNGFLDGVEACTLAAAENMPRHTVLYFDLETPDVNPRWKEYFWGWVEGVIAQDYRPGLYCSFLAAAKLVDFIKQKSRSLSPSHVPEIWTFNVDKYKKGQVFKDQKQFPTPDPTMSGAMSATSWQLIHNSTITWVDTVKGKPVSMPLKVDLNSSVYKDPGSRTSPAAT